MFDNLSSCDLSNIQDFYLAESYERDCYIAAAVEDSLIEKEPLTITIGDGNNIRGYYNAPLKSKSFYSVTLAIVVTTTVSIFPIQTATM